MQVAFVNLNYYFDINLEEEASNCATRRLWPYALGRISGVVLPLPLRGTV